MEIVLVLLALLGILAVVVLLRTAAWVVRALGVGGVLLLVLVLYLLLR
ncbi:MAG: hypothetical protein ACOYEW_17160 [Anaerolineae bacterium]|jgi:hypothetical protein